MDKGKRNGPGLWIMAEKSRARRPDAEHCHGGAIFFSLALHAGERDGTGAGSAA
jgi:hypothetical protein